MSKLELNKCCEDWITWHDVKDKMPEISTDVLVKFDDEIQIAWLDKQDNWHATQGCRCCGEYIGNVTYWMYLPEIPRIPTELDS